MRQATSLAAVFLALGLEGLLMVIKYSQLDLAGNLYYPVAVITSASLLLAALDIFLKLSGQHAAEPTGAHARSEFSSVQVV